MAESEGITKEQKELMNAISSMLSSLDESGRLDLIDRLRSLLDSERLGCVKASEMDRCPNCGSEKIYKYGFTEAGRQRYRCHSCHKTFSWSSGNLFRNTKLDDDQWYRFAECFVYQLSLPKCAEICDVCLKTAWFMRFRMMELIHRNLPSFEVKSDIRTQVDEIYIPESFKGNMKKAGFMMPRDPYRHGSTSHNVGIADKVCVFTAVNDLGDMFYEIACKGFFTKDAARHTLGKSVARGSVVATDDHGSYIKLLREMKVRHENHPATEHGPLNRVNSLHARIRGFLAPFRGVSTKYLDLYLGWFKWIDSYARGSVSDTVDNLTVQMSNGEYIHKRSMLRDIPFPFIDQDGGVTKYPIC